MSASAGPPKAAMAPKRHLTGAASKGYSVASAWDKSAPLNDQELGVVELLAAVALQRPCPSHITEDGSPSQQPSTSAPAASGSGSGAGGSGASRAAPDSADVGALEEAVLQNANQFHKWHAELEAARASETEQKYQQYADLLRGHLAACDAVQAKIDQTLGLFDSLLLLHRDVTGRSAQLSGACEALVGEKSQLLEFADSLRARLRFFDEFEAVQEQFQTTQAAPEGEGLLSLLRRLDECIAYVGANPQYADAMVYATRFKQLQGRALSMVKARVQQVLRAAVQQVAAGVSEAAGASQGGTPSGQPGAGPLSRSTSGQPMGVGAVPALPEGAEVSLLYVRFRAAAEPSLKGLFAELELRAQRPEYAKLLEECQALYCSTRQQLVQPFVAQRIAGLASAPLPQLLRGGCDQLARLAASEGALAEHFFPKGATTAPGPAELLRPLLEPVSTLLYDALRPRVVHLSDVDELCELIDILQHEVLGEQVARRGGAAEALAPSLHRSLADLQGRLIYRCQAFIKEAVAGYQPSAADVDYPACLERLAAAQQQQPAGQQLEQQGQPAAAAGLLERSGSSEIAAEGANGEAAAASEPLLEGGPAAAGHWYPPVRATLLVLSKLYQAVDQRIFSGLAQEAVAAASHSVQQAGRLVARNSVQQHSGPANGAGNGAAAAANGSAALSPQLSRQASGVLVLSGQLDAQLFVIKHLLFLREQIAPFNVEFAATDIDLDFTHMRDHMRRILAGEASLFTLSANNAVVQMLNRGGPRVVAAQLDSKRELEAQLKSACESFIMAVTKTAVEPMLGFLTKVTAVRVAANASKELAARPLKEQAFASPAKLGELVQRVNAAMTQLLPQVVHKAQLYLSNPNTRAILFRPVKSNIAEAHGQVASLLESEYSPEEAAQVPLMQPDQLGAVLDALV